MPPEGMTLAEEILHFWFEDCKPWQWFHRNEKFDQSVSERFGALAATAQENGLIHWEVNQTSALALVLDGGVRQQLAKGFSDLTA